VNQFSYAAYSCEMPESLFATFTPIDTFSQQLYSEVAAKFLAVLEAVSDGLCRAVNLNWNAINSYILDSLCQCLAGESDEAQFQATGDGLFEALILGGGFRTFAGPPAVSNGRTTVPYPADVSVVTPCLRLVSRQSCIRKCDRFDLTRQPRLCQVSRESCRCD
jgi:hypothetical protein